MKRNIFLTFAALFVLLFSSCSKDIDLNGTKWKSDLSKSITYMGMEGAANFTFDLHFVDATKYTLGMSGNISIMGQNMPVPEQSQEGTYTFDGEKGMFDEEQPFTYNSSKETITVDMTIDEQEFVNAFGTNTLTLTFKQI